MNYVINQWWRFWRLKYNAGSDAIIVYVLILMSGRDRVFRFYCMCIKALYTCLLKQRFVLKKRGPKSLTCGSLFIDRLLWGKRLFLKKNVSLFYCLWHAMGGDGSKNKVGVFIAVTPHIDGKRRNIFLLNAGVHNYIRLILKLIMLAVSWDKNRG